MRNNKREEIQPPKNIIDTSDQQIWKEKQVFMWAMFTRVLQTPKNRSTNSCRTTINKNTRQIGQVECILHINHIKNMKTVRLIPLLDKVTPNHLMALVK